MKIAGVKEFRKIVPDVLKEDEILLVTRRGKLAGILIPATDIKDLSREFRQELFEVLATRIGAELDQRGITEEKLIGDFKAWRKARRSAGSRR